MSVMTLGERLIAEAEPYCNHDAPAVDPDGICECGHDTKGATTVTMTCRLAWRIDGNSDPDDMAEAIDIVHDLVAKAVSTCWEAFGMNAERFTCDEAEQLARLLYMVEGPDLANDFLRIHIDSDTDEGDLGAAGHTTFVEADDVNGRD